MLSLDRPTRQFGRVGLVGEAERAQNAAWEAGHLGDVGEINHQRRFCCTRRVKLKEASDADLRLQCCYRTADAGPKG